MADFKCDSCQKTISEKDKYRLRCSGECRRNFCMTCTGLDKTTTKVIHQQKFKNIRFFCNVCDSPTMKYLHDKVSQLQKSQIPLETVEGLGTCLKRNNDLLPVISEIYDILSYHDSKWKSLYKKMDDIHCHHSKISENGQQSLFHSISEIKQEILNLSSIFMDFQDESVRVQVHDSSKVDLLKEVSELRRSVNQMATTIEKFAAQGKQNNRSSPPAIKKSTSTQTDCQASVGVTSSKVSTPPPHKPSIRKAWHYVVVSNIPSPFTANQLAHYIKDKLGTSDFIRCFPMLNSEDSSLSKFKVGVQNIRHLERLLDISMWPPGIEVVNSNVQPSLTPSEVSPQKSRSSAMGFQQPKISTLEKRSLPQSSNLPTDLAKEVKYVKIGSDREAIAASKSFGQQEAKNIINKHPREGEVLSLDPMTPPIVRLSRESDTANGRYLLARLRDPSILKAVRLFLAYLHDQPPSACFEGHTNTSIKLALASEGLPCDMDSLRKLFYRFHDAYGIGVAEVEADLSAFRTFFSSEKLFHLQKSRESHSKYFSSGSPSKNKNF